MKTSYTDAEIEALVEDVKSAFLEPAFQALSKAQSEKEVKTDKEAGNGTTPTPDDKRPAGDGERADTMKQAQPSTSGSGSGTNAPTTKAEDDGEKPAAAASEPSSASAESAPAPDASAAPSEAPESAPADPAMDQQMGDSTDLVSAYAQLDDETLKAHYEALKQVLMERMGMNQQQGPSAPMQGAPSPSPAASPSPAPTPSPSPSPAPQMAMKSEELSKREQELVKKEKEAETLLLKATEMAQVFTRVLSQPKPKAVTSSAEVLVKTESLTNDQIEKKLLEKARDPSLKKSDRELLLKYFTPNVKVEISEVEHLLK